ncbi:MAG: DUF1080 domain-containing protein, partial [Pedobacter sp.]|nr:DUF1080 domain-containing protein [Pedobacter sp.]
LQVHAVNSEQMAGKKVCFKNINIQTTNLKPKAFPSGVYVVNLKNNQLTAYEQKDGWKLLFDGKNTDQWRSAHGKNFPVKGWVVKDGIVTVNHSDGEESENGGDVVTKKEYSAFDFSFDFKYEEGANSGIKYFVTLDEKSKGSSIGLEYQILDDAVHPDAKLGRDGNRTLSSLYDLIKADKTTASIHPTATWNTGRIVVHPDNRVEHFLNGVKVLEYVRGSKEFKDLVAISKYKIWDEFGEAPMGHLLLQDHGAKVDFKNLKIKNL